jgi:hypothetical protein
MENLDMTKNTNTSDLSGLIKLKLSVIKYHNANPYTESSIARDACYTSFNSVQFKLRGDGQMADVAAEIKGLIPDEGQEITNVKLERLLDRYEGMEIELAILEDRHNADKAVYKEITGDEWTARPKRTFKSNGMSLDSRLAKFA